MHGPHANVLAVLRQRIVARQPLSLVRLGDDEGRPLGYPENVFTKEELDSSLHIWFGRKDSNCIDLADLSARLRWANLQTDTLGLLPIERRHHPLPQIERLSLGLQLGNLAKAVPLLALGLCYKLVFADKLAPFEMRQSLEPYAIWLICLLFGLRISWKSTWPGSTPAGCVFSMPCLGSRSRRAERSGVSTMSRWHWKIWIRP